MGGQLIAMPGPQLGDIPGQLRNLADCIESGRFAPDRAICVIQGPGLLEIFGYGHADAEYCLALLARATAKMVRNTSPEIEE